MGVQVKIVHSPFKPPMEVVGDILMTIHVPYSEKSVTLKINPNLQEYKEQQNNESVELRQVTVSTETVDTQTIYFDFEKNKIKKYKYEGKEYSIELVSIEKDGQGFLCFEFEVDY